MTQIRTLVDHLVARLDITSERGATAVEYGLLVGLIALVLITVIGTVGTNLEDTFDRVGQAIP